jgi:nucleoside-diphosphate-sugar epimerase
VNATIVRIFNTYGPRMNVNDGRVVPALAAAALAGERLPIAGDGRQTRSFCYVSDLVEGLLLVALDGGSDGEVFNLGNDHEISMLELAGHVARATGHDGRLSFAPAAVDDPSRRCPDLTKMRERYGWEPKVPLEDGLSATIAYFENSEEIGIAA